MSTKSICLNFIFFHFQRIKASLNYFNIQRKYLISEKGLKILIISGWHQYINWVKWPGTLIDTIKLPRPKVNIFHRQPIPIGTINQLSHIPFVSFWGVGRVPNLIPSHFSAMYIGKTGPWYGEGQGPIP